MKPVINGLAADGYGYASNGRLRKSRAAGRVRSHWAYHVAAIAAVMCVLGERTAAQSSDPPNHAPLQAGPVVLAPVLRLTNVGRDSNVFNNNSNDNPKSDMTATFSPSVDAWLRMAHGRANGRSQFDFYYFRTLTELRAIDSDSSAQIEFPINRFMPYVTGSFTNTRHRQNLEIDALARRRVGTIVPGVDVRLTAKATAGLFMRRSAYHYDPRAIYLNTDLSRVLNYKSFVEGANLRYALTPLTSVAVEVQQVHDRFESESARDSDNLRVTTGVRFSPNALISGGASIGLQKRKFLNGSSSVAGTGTIVAADLGYALLGRTRFGLTAKRELDYSYLIAQPDYINAGAGVSVTQRLGQAWDVGGSVGRYRLVYHHDPLSNTGARFYGSSDETVLISTTELVYNFGHSRAGIQLEYRERLADHSNDVLTDQLTVFRGYHRLRIGSTLTYSF